MSSRVLLGKHVNASGGELKESFKFRRITDATIPNNSLWEVLKNKYYLWGIITVSNISNRHDIMDEDDKLWPEEEKALDDIQQGKVQTIRQSGEDFLKELDELINAE